MEGDIMSVVEYWIQGEIGNFIKVWISVYSSLCYCYFVGKIVPKGTQRVLVILPVVCLFLILPLNLHTMHLGVTTAFFISWLSNFKLLMFAFDKGHLSDPSISVARFLALASLPIKIQQSPPAKSVDLSYQSEGEKPFQNGSHNESPPKKTDRKDHWKQKSVLNYTIKGILLASIIKIHDYSEQLHPIIIQVLYCFQIYFTLEIILGIAAALAHGIVGVELEPTFNEPLLSTSLQDFWGRRWNIMVNRILRPTVYDPVLTLSSKLFDRQWAPLPAVFSTFVVSGLMHELIFYYMGRRKPTGKASWFFLLHGVCLVLEVAVKKALKGRWQLPRPIARVLVAGFVVGTGLLLFLPEMLQYNADVRAFEEYAAVGAFVKDVTRALTSMSPTNCTRVQ